MRPSISSGTASAPDGAIPTSSEPTMLSTNPHIKIFTRPTRSARPPTTTMKMPENSAVIDTAMFMTLVATPRSAGHCGCDIERGLGEQPEGEHTEDDAEEELVVAAIRSWLSGHVGHPPAESFRSALPTLALRRFAEDWQRPAVA